MFLLNGADASVSTIAPAYLQQLGFPLASIGVLLAVYSVTALLSRMPAGRMADGRWARQWFFASCALFAVMLLLYPLAQEAWSFLLVRALHGFAFGASTTLNMASALAAGSQNRARNMSFYASAMAAGFTLGNLTGGFVADWLGIPATFVVAATFPLLSALVGASRASGIASAQAGGGGLLAVLGRREVRGVFVLAVSLNLLHQGWGTLFPLYAVSIGAGLTLAGSVRAAHSFTNTLARPLGQPVVHRLGVSGLACFGLVLYGGSIASLSLTAWPPLLLAIAVVIGIGRASAYLANVVATAELSDRKIVNRGTASALVSMGGDVGSIFAPILAGFTASQVGIGPALQVLGVTLAFLGIAGVLSTRTAHGEAG